MTLKTMFFYANIEIDNTTIGITKKVIGQIRAFQNLGYKVIYSCYKSDCAEIIEAGREKVLMKKSFPPLLKKEIRRYVLMNLSREFTKNALFDLIYVRYHYFDQTCLRMLEAFHSSSKSVVMEMHSFPCLFKKMGLVGLLYYIDKLFTKKCVNYVNLFTNMSEQQLPFEKPQIQIANTIDSIDISKRTPNGKTEIIKLLSVAYERDGHGFDRIIRGLKKYNADGGTQKVEILFVGKYFDKTHRLVNELGLQESCFFFPPADSIKLDEFYDIADIAIGHLANHRIGSYSGSSIKVQEYFAKGIPFIYAWNEINVPYNYKYALKFELDDTPLDFAKIIEFYNSIINPDKAAIEMREFFETFAGWKNQLKSVTDYLN